MKKNIMILIATTLVFAITVIGATLAFFTDEGEVTNTFVTGDVAITLHDLLGEEDFPVEEGIENITPGDEFDKNVFVSSQGSIDTYVRVQLIPSWDPEEVEEGQDLIPLDINLVELDLDLDNWILIDDWYYYMEVLEEDEETSKLLDGLVFSTDIDNNYANASFSIEVIAEGIQATNDAAETQWGVDTSGW